MEDDVRRELDLLREGTRDLRQAISDLDNHGSRGVLQIQQQVLDLIKDMSEVKLALQVHEQQHEREEADRKVGRRWLIGSLIGGVGCFATVIGILLDISRHVH
jgi:hypothetical protein